MHDANGTPLKVGDIVNIPYQIVSLSDNLDYCNVSLETMYSRQPNVAETMYGRQPNGRKDKLISNTNLLVLVHRSQLAT